VVFNLLTATGKEHVKKNMKKQIIALLVTGLLAGSVAFATPIAPSYGTFVNLPGATYGGSGIPTDPSAIRSIANGGNTITLALTAHNRYSNPPLVNNGAGTFFATPGINDGLEGQSLGPTWNFGLYIELAAAIGNTEVYNYALRYGNNTTDTFTTLPIPGGSSSGIFQDSWNLTMPFLNTIAYNPNAPAQYAFELQAFNSAGALLGTSAINVNVAGVPDASSTGLLSILGLAAIIVFARMQRRQTN